MKYLTLAALLITLVATACAPDFSYDVSRVDGPRVLAVRAVPPEIGPNQQTTLIALYVDENGTLSTGPLKLTLCNARKPLAELGPIARACLDPNSSSQMVLGTNTLSASATVPANTCALFGPSPPPAKPDEPAGRPVDPDGTGGFYQPALVFDEANGEPSLAQLRISCGIGAVPPGISIEWNRRSRRNANPIIETLSIVRDDAEQLVPLAGSGAPPVVAPGETITLRAAYPACPAPGEDVCGDQVCGNDETLAACPADCTAPLLGCGGAEAYVAYDGVSGTIVSRREAMRVAWYTTAGEYGEARTGRAEDDATTSSDNTFVVPTEPGAFSVWVVLRDDRGGTAFRSYELTVGAP